METNNLFRRIWTDSLFQNTVCFKTSFVLVKNISDKVILGLPFIHLLLPFTTDVDGITIASFGQPVKFEFLQ
jgi:hypothetical protein